MRSVALGLAILVAVWISGAARAEAGLFGDPSKEGICASVSPSFVALIDDNKQTFVFNVPANFQLPQGLTAGVRIKVSYKKLQNGLLEAKKIQIK